MDKFIEHCDMAMSPIPDMGYYSSVALCAFDAVFSIQSRYNSVVSPLIDRLCSMIDIPRHLENQSVLPRIEEQIKVSEFQRRLRRLNCLDPATLAEKLNNRQRTSSRNGILKADAFLQYLEEFKSHEIETFQDVFSSEEKRAKLEQSLRKITGQNVAVDYFFMLAGNKDDVKVDTWIKRFVHDALGKDIPESQIKQLFKEAAEYYRNNGYPDMTVRHLDHIIWNWQKSR